MKQSNKIEKKKVLSRQEEVDLAVRIADMAATEAGDNPFIVMKIAIDLIFRGTVNLIPES